MKKTALATLAILSLLSVAPAVPSSAVSRSTQNALAVAQDGPREHEDVISRIARRLLKHLRSVASNIDLPVPPRP
jgi:hypothetical protein